MVEPSLPDIGLFIPANVGSILILASGNLPKVGSFLFGGDGGGGTTIVVTGGVIVVGTYGVTLPGDRRRSLLPPTPAPIKQTLPLNNG
jgi:hypothetical protein